jgi:AcrR family transcriptional regulator
MNGKPDKPEREKSARDKHDVILRAAQTVFLRDGFSTTSMEVIAREAEVSKQTVYNHFAGKEELFRAVIERRCALMEAELDKGFLQHGDDIEQVLTAFGQNILDVMLSPQSMWLKRLLQTEGRRHPQLAETYYRLGPDATANRLADFFSDQIRRDRLAIRDPRIAAEQFVSMLPGHLRMRHLIGMTEPPTRAERKRWVTSAVRLFLDGARPRETERGGVLRSMLRRRH